MKQRIEQCTFTMDTKEKKETRELAERLGYDFSKYVRMAVREQNTKVKKMERAKGFETSASKQAA